MPERKILFVLTGHDRLGPAGDDSVPKTGFHLAEAALPWAVLTEAGFCVDFVTPAGGPAPIDPSSRETDNPDAARFLDDDRVKRMLENTSALHDVSLEDYDAIYFPGGHGTMWDLPGNEAVQDAVRSLYENGRVVAAVCHGPAALVNVKLSDGSWLVAGKTVSVFTDEEERSVDKDSVVPFLLASKLGERGATIAKADNFQSSVSVDGRLVTGQNPASARELGERIRDLVNKQVADAA